MTGKLQACRKYRYKGLTTVANKIVINFIVLYLYAIYRKAIVPCVLSWVIGGPKRKALSRKSRALHEAAISRRSQTS